MIRRTGARMVFLDNVAHLFPGDENARGEVTQFINLLNRLASDTSAAIVLLGHPNKGGDNYSGSTGWLNAVRSQVTMERPKGSEHDPDLRSVSVGKPHYARAGEVLRCRWSDWAFIRAEDLPDDQREQLADVIAASSENAAFLECLRARSCQGEARAVGPKPGPSYAPTQFEAMPQARGHDRYALKRAMERLVSIGKIEFVEVRNAAKGRNLTVIRGVETGANGASPNSTPNSSRTLFPDSPEPIPTPPRTAPEHSPLPKGGVGGGPLGGLHTPLNDGGPAYVRL
jgi:RecA-family ATPase